MEPTILPLTQERWPDLELLFGERGACGGCWCMWWRLARSEFERQKGEGNRQAFKALVEAGRVPGLLAYRDGTPVGWCSVAPRLEFPVLQRSRILKPIDDIPVWSVVCFFVDKAHRNAGLTLDLLRSAAGYVREQGGQVVEGYPVDPSQDRVPASSAYTGLASAFRQAGFVECLRRSETRPIMRLYLGGVDGILNYLVLSERIGTAGQPRAEQFATVGTAGYEVVVNLSLPTSTNALPNEGELVAEAGMEYVHIPVVWENPTRADLSRFFAVMERCQERKVFVHCALNMRVSAFLFLYRVLRLGVPPAEARQTMLRIWEPEGVWAEYIDEALAGEWDGSEDVPERV